MKTMYDSVDLSQIPLDAQAVAGYIGGNWPTYKELAGRFPLAHRLSIAVTPHETAECLDVENGDASPADVVGWVRRMESAGIWRPCVYANAATMPAVLAELQHGGIERSRVRLWVAYYTGVPTLPAGFDACQWTDRALGRNLDESLVSDEFFPTMVHVPTMQHQGSLHGAQVSQQQLAHEHGEPLIAIAPKPPRARRRPPAPHRKVVGATGGGGLGVAITGALQAFGVVHLTPAEAAAIATLVASLAGYLTPSRQ